MEHIKLHYLVNKDILLQINKITNVIFKKPIHSIKFSQETHFVSYFKTLKSQVYNNYLLPLIQISNLQPNAP